MRQLEPDDDVYHYRGVFLGPRGWSFPWQAEFVAYGVWSVTLAVIVVVEALLPGVPVFLLWRVPLVELLAAWVVTVTVMGHVDHERPVRTVAVTALAERWAHWTRPRPTVVRRRLRGRIR